MKNRKWSYSLLTALLSLVSHAAFAGWSTHVEDDVFTGGQKAMLVDVKSELNGVVFDCSKDHLKVSYIESGDTTDITDGIQAELVFKVDQSKPVKFDALTTTRNNNFFGVKSAENDDSLKLLLSELKAASHHILVGVHYLQSDQKYSYTFDTIGSAKAVNKFVKACEIDLSGISPQKS
ncbi:hypothetical protein [Cedecea sp. NFIX57]|uniref:hypothetical protein n=1 Tax=Cedecea sp. NFIX57 TaxID=1566286 RepID=UPI000A0AB2EE|nr:hypothetical protein [Cedecea sp. NFIX57]SMG62022.1 hypothetical protein SAMN03159353_11013 [Cedecea sp. NFIX57]